MRYPEFRDAEYSTTNIPTQSFFITNIKRIKKYIFLITCFALIVLVSFHFFSLILSETKESYKLNLISIGSALVTVFSALISVFTLISSSSINKYEDNISLLQTRYLEGRKIFKWEFLKRSSNYLAKSVQKHNYYISSACYKLYSGETDESSLVIVVPILEVDFYDIPCIRQIFRIKKFLPNYLLYINEEQKKYGESGYDSSKKPPNYYLPLPNHLIALYKNIIIYKAARLCIEICFLFIVSATCMTIIGMF